MANWQIGLSVVVFDLLIPLPGCATSLSYSFVHLMVTLARLARPGGLRSVVAESVLVRHQLLILNRARKRAPNLRATDRIIAGLCTLFVPQGMCPSFRHPSEAFHSAASPQCAAPTKVPHVVFG
jgi:hypothetical protein